MLGNSRVPLTLVPAPSSTVFGDVLNLAASRASGDLLLKMDDDDWYSPLFVSDLVLARMYSSADVVGMASEFNFVEPLWSTVRHGFPSEVYRDFVAGGTLMATRSAFVSVGGFRSVRKYVDASLLSAVRQAGGTIFRTQGLGYVLRRTDAGHTWDPGLEWFTDESRVDEQWTGFTPSRVLEHSLEDEPKRTSGE
jgi:hypothetical protein